MKEEIYDSLIYKTKIIQSYQEWQGRLLVKQLR